MSVSTVPSGFATKAIHAGYDPSAYQGALNPPIHWSSTFAFDSAEQGAARFAGEEPGMIYSRVTNPTVQLLEGRIAALEGGEAGLAFGSGMGALCTLLWTILRPGDQLVVDLTLYGCTHALVNRLLPEFGITTRIADFTRLEDVAEAVNAKTKIVLFETPANPNMRVADIAAISTIVHRQSSALVVVDSTYCTPYLQRPLELGADVVLHSLTKYMNGHGDVIAGALVGTHELMMQVRMVGLKELTGACMSPMDAYLVLRGLKTLPVRMEHHCRAAEAIADFLVTRPEVAIVHYPGLTTHPQYEIVKRQMRHPGGMLAFELHGGVEAGRKFINALNLITRAVSLGDAESLAQHPASMTHAPYTPEERERHLIPEGLVRLSVGLEDLDDIVRDLMQALEGTSSSGIR
jgi:methionine-gamma-lyase